MSFVTLEDGKTITAAWGHCEEAGHVAEDMIDAAPLCSEWAFAAGVGHWGRPGTAMHQLLVVLLFNLASPLFSSYRTRWELNLSKICC